MKYAYYLRTFWPIYLVTALLTILLAFGTEEAVNTVADQIPIERNVTIVIDAGHGGEDGGAISCTGVLESHINLQIALRLEALCHLLGYRTHMIRCSDISIYTEGNSIAAKKVSDLKNRVRIVNDTENAILISIHQNIFPDCRYSGAQVFYNDMGGAMLLAESMQTLFVNTINPGSSRKIKKAESIYLMEHISKPGILVECGFLSNPEEEIKLQNTRYQQKICCVIVTSLSSYLHS